MQIVKRSGKIVEFLPIKIAEAIIKAMDETEAGRDEDLAWAIAEDIELEFEEEDIIPEVETVQDRVEELLAVNDRFDVSRKYIIYREGKKKLRKQGWEMSDLQKDIFEKKYRFSNEDFDDFLNRVSGGDKDVKKNIRDKKFMPAGRILAGRGLDKFGRKIVLSNCFVLPKVEDNIESIFDSAKWMARTYSYGGGVGLNVSNLRPGGSKVNNAAMTTTGAISFMELYSMVTSLIGMRGRRGALMLNMDINHPDIEAFIDVKRDLDKVTSANISVNVTDEFMEAVERDEEYLLEFEVEATEERITKVVKAKDLFRKLAYNNWDNAEPGILYQDRINSWHLMSEDPDFEYEGVNPCAEEPLPGFGSCNLSSINLSNFVKHPFTDRAEFNYDEFKQMVHAGVVYLNDILDENMRLFPLPQQREVAMNLRQIGLGIMGTADLFIKMGIKYGSEESIELSHEIGRVLADEAMKASALLAKQYGAFPAYKKEAVLKSEFLKKNASKETLKLIKKHGLRNSQLLTIAPTGTISTLMDCSNGIEPLFQVSYTRKSESLHEADTYYTVFTGIAKEYMEYNNIRWEEDLPDYFITTSTLNYKDRINVQAAWQDHIDAGISSTVNVPNKFTVEEVEDLYMYAWKKGIKGITIYRDGCSRVGILTKSKPKNTEEIATNREDRIDQLREEMDKLLSESLIENPDTCPMCGGEMNHSGGCAECQICGYSPCSI